MVENNPTVMAASTNITKISVLGLTLSIGVLFVNMLKVFIK